MKTVGIIGLVLAIIGMMAATYCQIEIVPAYDFFDTKLDMSPFDRSQWHSYGEQKFMLGNIAMLAGIISLIIGVIATIKKLSLGWITILLGIIALLIGASQATHLFS